MFIIRIMSLLLVIALLCSATVRAQTKTDSGGLLLYSCDGAGSAIRVEDQNRPETALQFKKDDAAGHSCSISIKNSVFANITFLSGSTSNFDGAITLDNVQCSPDNSAVLQTANPSGTAYPACVVFQGGIVPSAASQGRGTVVSLHRVSWNPSQSVTISYPGIALIIFKQPIVNVSLFSVTDCAFHFGEIAALELIAGMVGAVPLRIFGLLFEEATFHDDMFGGNIINVAQIVIRNFDGRASKKVGFLAEEGSGSICWLQLAKIVAVQQIAIDDINCEAAALHFPGARVSHRCVRFQSQLEQIGQLRISNIRGFAKFSTTRFVISECVHFQGRIFGPSVDGIIVVENVSFSFDVSRAAAQPDMTSINAIKFSSPVENIRTALAVRNASLLCRGARPTERGFDLAINLVMVNEQGDSFGKRTGAWFENIGLLEVSGSTLDISGSRAGDSNVRAALLLLSWLSCGDWLMQGQNGCVNGGNHTLLVAGNRLLFDAVAASQPNGRSVSIFLVRLAHKVQNIAAFIVLNNTMSSTSLTSGGSVLVGAVWVGAPAEINADANVVIGKIGATLSVSENIIAMSDVRTNGGDTAMIRICAMFVVAQSTGGGMAPIVPDPFAKVGTLNFTANIVSVLALASSDEARTLISIFEAQGSVAEISRIVFRGNRVTAAGMALEAEVAALHSAPDPSHTIDNKGVLDKIGSFEVEENVVEVDMVQTEIESVSTISVFSIKVIAAGAIRNVDSVILLRRNKVGCWRAQKMAMLTSHILGLDSSTQTVGGFSLEGNEIALRGGANGVQPSLSLTARVFTSKGANNEMGSVVLRRNIIRFVESALRVADGAGQAPQLRVVCYRGVVPDLGSLTVADNTLADIDAEPDGAATWSDQSNSRVSIVSIIPRSASTPPSTTSQQESRIEVSRNTIETSVRVCPAAPTFPGCAAVNIFSTRLNTAAALSITDMTIVDIDAVEKATSSTTSSSSSSGSPNVTAVLCDDTTAIDVIHIGYSSSGIYSPPPLGAVRHGAGIFAPARLRAAVPGAFAHTELSLTCLNDNISAFDPTDFLVSPSIFPPMFKKVEYARCQTASLSVSKNTPSRSESGSGNSRSRTAVESPSVSVSRGSATDSDGNSSLSSSFNLTRSASPRASPTPTAERTLTGRSPSLSVSRSAATFSVSEGPSAVRRLPVLESPITQAVSTAVFVASVTALSSPGSFLGMRRILNVASLTLCPYEVPYEGYVEDLSFFESPTSLRLSAAAEDSPIRDVFETHRGSLIGNGLLLLGLVVVLALAVAVHGLVVQENEHQGSDDDEEEDAGGDDGTTETAILQVPLISTPRGGGGGGGGAAATTADEAAAAAETKRSKQRDDQSSDYPLWIRFLCVVLPKRYRRVLARWRMPGRLLFPAIILSATTSPAIGSIAALPVRPFLNPSKATDIGALAFVLLFLILLPLVVLWRVAAWMPVCCQLRAVDPSDSEQEEQEEEEEEEAEQRKEKRKEGDKSKHNKSGSSNNRDKNGSKSKQKDREQQEKEQKKKDRERKVAAEKAAERKRREREARKAEKDRKQSVFSWWLDPWKEWVSIDQEKFDSDKQKQEQRRKQLLQRRAVVDEFSPYGESDATSLPAVSSSAVLVPPQISEFFLKLLCAAHEDCGRLYFLPVFDFMVNIAIGISAGAGFVCRSRECCMNALTVALVFSSLHFVMIVVWLRSIFFCRYDCTVGFLFSALTLSVTIVVFEMILRGEEDPKIVEMLAMAALFLAAVDMLTKLLLNIKDFLANNCRPKQDQEVVGDIKTKTQQEQAEQDAASPSRRGTGNPDHQQYHKDASNQSGVAAAAAAAPAAVSSSASSPVEKKVKIINRKVIRKSLASLIPPDGEAAAMTKSAMSLLQRPGAAAQAGDDDDDDGIVMPPIAPPSEYDDTELQEHHDDGGDDGDDGHDHGESQQPHAFYTGDELRRLLAGHEEDDETAAPASSHRLSRLEAAEAEAEAVAVSGNSGRQLVVAPLSDDEDDADAEYAYATDDQEEEEVEEDMEFYSPAEMDRLMKSQ